MFRGFVYLQLRSLLPLRLAMPIGVRRRRSRAVRYVSAIPTAKLGHAEEAGHYLVVSLSASFSRQGLFPGICSAGLLRGARHFPELLNSTERRVWSFMPSRMHEVREGAPV
jgi:hypothetical protein